MDEHISVYPGDPTVHLAPAATVAADGFAVLHVRMGSQSGTHLDAPAHFLADGATVEELPLDRCLLPAVVADVRGATPDRAIGWEDLAAVVPQLRPGVALVLHTGWSVHWGTDAYLAHPHLDADAARQLVDHGVVTVGIDALSIDATVLDGEHPTGFATHHVLLGAGVPIVENLTGLEQIVWDDPVLSVLPVKLADADGAPVRAVAIQW